MWRLLWWGLAVWRAGLEDDVYSGSGLTTLLSAPLSYVELLGLASGNSGQNKLFPGVISVSSHVTGK